MKTYEGAGGALALAVGGDGIPSAVPEVSTCWTPAGIQAPGMRGVHRTPSARLSRAFTFSWGYTQWSKGQMHSFRKEMSAVNRERPGVVKRTAGGRQGLCGRVPSSRRTNVTSRPRARRTKGWRGNHVVCAAKEAREAGAAAGGRAAGAQAGGGGARRAAGGGAAGPWREGVAVGRRDLPPVCRRPLALLLAEWIVVPAGSLWVVEMKDPVLGLGADRARTGVPGPERGGRTDRL